MLSQQIPQVQPMLMQFVVCDVQRVNDWLVRECPECHHTGYVSIYLNRAPEAMNFIARADWVCKPCADIQREVDQNFHAKGGDTLVN